ncbi:MAG: hypothetical protein ABSC16_08270 [Candidatus Dormibacteria bacterium]
MRGSRPGRRWPPHLLALSLTGAVLGFAAATPGTVAAGPPGLTFANSGVTGGGFISVLAQSPTGTLIAGGDTQGFFRSVDGGATWTPQDQGLPAAAYSVAALLDQGGTWYAAVGSGSSGGIATSTDDGVTWSYDGHAGSGTPPTFDGNNLPGQQGQPRATGDLLASDGTYLYAASFGRGLQRWPLESATPAAGWQCVALCTSYLNSMALDGSGDAFVSVISRTGASKGVYEVTGLSAHAKTKSLSAKRGISTGVQELVHLGSRVYAAGADGIGYWSKGSWATLDASPHWYTLTGYETSAGPSPVDVLYAATYAGKGASDVEQLVVTGRGTTITPLVPPGSVSTTIEGTSTEWWEATDAGSAGSNLGPSAMIGGCPSSTLAICDGSTADVFAGSSIVTLGESGGLDPLLVGGRSGVWSYEPQSSPAWSPAVMGLASTFDLAVAVDPADSSNVAVADADWGVLASTDGFASVDELVDPPLLASVSYTGLGVAWDPSVSPSALIIAGGARQTDSLGSIWYSAGWASGGGWTSLPLPAGVTARPIALATAATGPGDYLMVAAFQGTGVYAFSGSGTAGSWTLIPSPPGGGGPTVSPTDVHGVSLSWADDGSALYMYDEGTHAVWMSTVAAGVFSPWVELYANTSASAGRGWVAGDPVTPTQVWVADSNGLGMIDTSGCSGDCTPVWLIPSSGTGDAGGPLAAFAGADGDGVDMAAGGVQPAFWQVQVTGCAVTCPEVTEVDDPYYATVAGNATALAVGGDGTAYVATLGNGIAVGTAGGG